MARYLISFIFLLVKLSIFSKGCQILTDQGDYPVFQCTFPDNVTSVTWQGTETGWPVKLLTCSFENDTCSSYLSGVIGITDRTNGTRRTLLRVGGVSNHTVTFECIPDNGFPDTPCVMHHMYVWPRIPVCVANVTDTYVEITCITGHVYPALNAVLYRREENLRTEDYVAGYPKCILSEQSSGLYDGTCTWRIPMERMLAVSTFYVEMTANVSDASAVGREPSTSNNITVTLEAPEVVVYRRNCPLGPGAIEQSVLIGAQATCKCELTSLKYPAVARWYTTDNRTVGDEDPLDRSSTITFSYNSSDPNQTYVCRLVSTLPTNVSEVTYTPTFTNQNCIQAIEKRPWQFITSKLPKNVASITWQLISGFTHINLSTCNVTSSKCSDTELSLYMADIDRNENRTILTLLDPRLNETQFAYVTDDGQRIEACPVGFFVPAEKPICDQRLSEDYVEYTCTTEKVYPRADARLVRNKVYLTEDDFAPGYPRCVLGDRSDGNFNQTCVWRIPMTKMIPFSQISVVMRPKLKTETVRTEMFPPQSDVVLTSLSVPYVVINKDYCPHSLWFRGDTIPIGATATCKCDLMYVGFPSASASWYDKHNKSVGVYYEILSQATLTVSYNSSDPNQSYECRPITPLRAQVNSVTYTPKFSSAPRNSAFELLYLIVVLGAVWTGIQSRLS